MSLVLDIALAGIVALCAWRGFRSGIINGVCWILAIVIAVYGASLVATAYRDDVAEVVEPFAISVVENAMNGGDSAGSGGEGADGDADSVIDPGLSVEEREKLDVYTVSMAVMGKLGFADPAAESIARSTADLYDKVSSAMTEYLTGLICDRASFILIYAIAFIVIISIFTVIANIVDLSFGIPGHENLNHITGAALGVIRGILILLVIGCFCRYAGILIKPAVTDKTVIYKVIVLTNKLAELLKL